jgi:hypothetical protein
MKEPDPKNKDFVCTCDIPDGFNGDRAMVDIYRDEETKELHIYPQAHGHGYWFRSHLGPFSDEGDALDAINDDDYFEDVVQK